jgi:hypothetical protein
MSQSVDTTRSPMAGFFYCYSENCYLCK